MSATWTTTLVRLQCRGDSSFVCNYGNQATSTLLFPLWRKTSWEDALEDTLARAKGRRSPSAAFKGKGACVVQKLSIDFLSLAEQLILSISVMNVMSVRSLMERKQSVY